MPPPDTRVPSPPQVERSGAGVEDGKVRADVVRGEVVGNPGHDRGRPRLWERFREKYRDDPRVLNFFFGSDPRESDRIARMQQQIAFNYAPGAAARVRVDASTR